MESIVERRSIRKYKAQEVPKEQIEQIVEAAIKAPSAKNRQPWKYLIYSDQGKKQLLDAMEIGLDNLSKIPDFPAKSNGGLADAYNTLKIMREAPILIIVMNTNGNSPFEGITPDARITEICDSLSIGASVENMLLKATELGLGTLWIANTFYAYNEMMELIGEKGQLVCAVAVGYPDESPSARPRRGLADVIEWR